MQLLQFNYHLIASSIFLCFIVAAHLAATNDYRFFHNTMSDLASQQYDRKIIMQFGFVLFGSVLAIGTGLNEINLRTSPIMIYGLCMAALGIFCVKPFFKVESFSAKENKLHVFFSITAGAAFGMGIFFQFWFSPEKFVHLIFLVPIIGLSVTYSVLKNYKGTVQKTMYVVGLTWLTTYYAP